MVANFKTIKYINESYIVECINLDDNIYLSLKEMVILFDVDESLIIDYINDFYHKNNSLKDETSKNITLNNKLVTIYNLDIILTIGYHFNFESTRKFRKWIDDFMLTKVIKNNNYIDVIKEYESSLDLLDKYDHQNLSKPEGSKTKCHLSYEDSLKLINLMRFKKESTIFGVEKEQGKLNSILNIINLNIFDNEIYSTCEEKASNLLYFLIKDHPFIDGCKRIAATLFLEFLNINSRLIKNGNFIISKDALVSLVILIAESKPEEKDVMIKLIMNILISI